MRTSKTTRLPSNFSWLQEDIWRDYCWKQSHDCKQPTGKLIYSFFRLFWVLFLVQCTPVRTKTSIFQLDRQTVSSYREKRLSWQEGNTHFSPAGGFCVCCSRAIWRGVAMEMEKGHMSIRRGVSWSPGGLRKPLQATQDVHTPGTECNASWEKTGFNKEQMSRKTSKCLFIWHFLSLYGERKQGGGVLLLCYCITHKCCCKYIPGSVALMSQYGLNSTISSQQKTYILNMWWEE